MALRLAHDQALVAEEHRLVAPTLIRSDMLSRLCQAVRRGELTREEAGLRLTYVRGLRMRLLGDRVQQDTAWKVADRLGLPVDDSMRTDRVMAVRLLRSPLTDANIRLCRYDHIIPF